MEINYFEEYIRNLLSANNIEANYLSQLADRAAAAFEEARREGKNVVEAQEIAIQIIKELLSN